MKKTNNKLTEIIKSSGVETTTAKYLKDQFMPFFDQADEWTKKAKALVVTSAEQSDEMAKAREARLIVKQIRINADKTRKSLKEDSLRYGKAVQGIYNVIEFLIVPIEEYLIEQENFVKIQEAKKRVETSEKRLSELEPYDEFAPYGIDLGQMDDEDYKKLLKGAKLQLQEKIDREKKAEQLRLEQIKAEEAERKRIAEENIQLKKDAESREIQLVEERKHAEAEQAKVKKQADAENAKLRKEAEAREEQLDKERVANQKLADEKKEAEEAEQARIRKHEEEERIAKAAPDKVKLLKFADHIESEMLAISDLKTLEARRILKDSNEYFEKAIQCIRHDVKTILTKKDAN